MLPAAALIALTLAGASGPPPGLAGEIDGVWEATRASGDFARAGRDFDQLMLRVLATVPATDVEPFVEVAMADRLATQLATLEPPVALELLEWLSRHETLAAAMAFSVARGEEPRDVYLLLDRLRRERGDIVAEYANLAAAICVVHDKPLRRRINENTVEAPDPLHIFDYYVRFEKNMLFGVRRVPPELLIYVVDTTASIEEMLWALERYAGDAAVGQRFFDIEYDQDHFRKGAPKKVTQAGFSLPNILRYGGVCADQAYFAMMVGKAIGVPTAYATGASSTVAHAWVGFLEARGRRGWWNFDVGRYDAYQGVRGTVLEPQRGRRIPDSVVSLLAELIGTSEDDRHAAIALTDAADRLLRVTDMPRPPDDVTGGDEPVRQATVDDALDLVEQALRRNPACEPAWWLIWRLAEEKALTLEQTKRWAEVLHRLCGQRYPDFYLTMLRPMILSIDDVREQNELWNRAFKQFSNRADLAASVRMSQARMWEDAGQPARAGQCYEDVINRYADAGPFVLDALAEAERLLAEAGQGRRTLALYERAFRSLRKPRDMAGPFYRQSNWFKVGVLYADRLDAAGMGLEARGVRGQL